MKDSALFKYPLALSKLGLFVMQAHKFKYEKAKNRPLILVTSNPETKTSLVIAVLGPNQDSSS